MRPAGAGRTTSLEPICCNCEPPRSAMPRAMLHLSHREDLSRNPARVDNVAAQTGRSTARGIVPPRRWSYRGARHRRQRQDDACDSPVPLFGRSVYRSRRTHVAVDFQPMSGHLYETTGRNHQTAGSRRKLPPLREGLPIFQRENAAGKYMLTPRANPLHLSRVARV